MTFCTPLSDGLPKDFLDNEPFRKWAGCLTRAGGGFEQGRARTLQRQRNGREASRKPPPENIWKKRPGNFLEAVRKDVKEAAGKLPGSPPRENL